MSICTKLKHNKRTHFFHLFEKHSFNWYLCMFFFSLSLHFISKFPFHKIVPLFFFFSLLHHTHKKDCDLTITTTVQLLWCLHFRPEDRLFCYIVFVRHSPFNLFTFATLCVQIKRACASKRCSDLIWTTTKKYDQLPRWNMTLFYKQQDLGLKKK